MKLEPIVKWQVTCGFLLVMLMVYGYLSVSTLKDANIYLSYQPLFEGLANQSLQVVPSYYSCSDLRGYPGSFNFTGNENITTYIDEPSGT